MFKVGDTVGGYQLISRVSEGGMASLFLGRRAGVPGEAPVAIKVIHEHLSEDWQFLRMFVDEALISVRIRHPNVVRVDELGDENGTYYLVMEFIHGCSLAQLLRAMGRAGRRMRPEIAAYIVSRAAAGLHAAHEMTGHDGQNLGVIHRDISPQNILLAQDGEVKVIDFGIAKAAGRAERTEAGVIKGKLRYMSPEQAIGGTVDRRVDVYALGVVLWELLTMRRFIEGKSDVEILRKVQDPGARPPSLVAPGVPPAIDQAVMQALQVRVDQRPPTAEAFQRLLEAAVAPGSVQPAHVAELLHLFVAEEVEAAAKALPSDLAKPYVEAWKNAQEEGTTQEHVRVRVGELTNPAARISFEGPATSEPPAPQSPAREEPTKAARPEPPPQAPFRPSFPDYGQIEDDSVTVSDPGVFGTSTADVAPAKVAPPPEPSAPSRPGVVGWAVRVALITLVAFAAGAGIAVLWVRLMK